MTGAVTDLTVEKSISKWFEPLHVRPGELLLELTDALSALSLAEWEERAARARDRINGIGFEENPAQLTLCLIVRALTGAAFELVREVLPRLIRLEESDRPGLLSRLELTGLDRAIPIGPSFFDSPCDLPLMDIVREAVGRWLAELGLEPPMARALLERFGPYYLSALDREWLAHGPEYAPLRFWAPGVFTERNTLSRAWHSYGVYLEKEWHGPYGGEATLCLHQLFVPPRAWYAEPEGSAKVSQNHEPAGPIPESGRRVVDLAAELERWVEGGSREAPLHVVTGAPGLGQKTFSLFFAAQVHRSRAARVLWVPLSEWSINGDFTKNLERFLARSHGFPQSPLEEDDQTILLIFHRLNDLPYEDMDQATSARGFMRKVRSLFDSPPAGKNRLLILVTGWEDLVSLTVDVLPKDARVYHLIPLDPEPDARDGWIDPEGFMALDGRDIWWRKFGGVTDRGYNGLPEELRQKSILNPLTGNPLYGSTLAWCYERNPSRVLDWSDPNQAFEDYLREVHKQAFDQRRPYRWTCFLEPENFENILEEAAVLSWHHRNRSVGPAHLQARLFGWPQADLEAFFELCRSGVIPLVDIRLRPGLKTWEIEEAFHFQHPTIIAYLAARRILTELDALREETDRRRGSPYHGLGLTEALRRWFHLCAPVEINLVLWQFMRLQLTGRDQAWLEAVQDFTRRMIQHLMIHGLVLDQEKWERIPGKLVRGNRNMAEALLGVHQLMAEKTGRRTRIDWPWETSAGEWIRWIQGQRFGSSNRLALLSLGYLNLDDCMLDGIDLIGANLSHSSIRRTSILNGLLIHADLTAAELIASDLRYARLGRVRAAGVNLRKARLCEADLKEAQLIEADCREASFTHADMRKINAAGTDFTHADLSGVDLRDACLTRSSFQGANLSRADLRGADLQNVDFTRANLKNAVLEGAKMKWANLDRAELQGARISGEKA